jgi:hypothetical protein
MHVYAREGRQQPSLPPTPPPPPPAPPPPPQLPSPLECEEYCRFGHIPTHTNAHVISTSFSHLCTYAPKHHMHRAPTHYTQTRSDAHTHTHMHALPHARAQGTNGSQHDNVLCSTQRRRHHRAPLLRVPSTRHVTHDTLRYLWRCALRRRYKRHISQRRGRSRVMCQTEHPTRHSIAPTQCAWG